MTALKSNFSIGDKVKIVRTAFMPKFKIEDITAVVIRLFESSPNDDFYFVAQRPAWKDTVSAYEDEAFLISRKQRRG